MFRLGSSLAAVLAAALIGCAQAPRPVATGPNVVLVSIDSLRADHLGCYGYERETSPTIDRLAREGVLFETVVAESSWTLPTHHTMLTGLSSRVHGVLEDDRALSAEHVTLAERLHAAGYRTHGVWSGPYLHPVFGFGQGFDEWIGVGQSAAFDALGPMDEASEVVRRRTIRQASVHSHDAVTGPGVLAEARAFLEREHERAFFLFVHFFDVHYNYIPSEEDWRAFDPDYAGDYVPTSYMADPNVSAGMDARELFHVVARYDAEIRVVDRLLGEFVATLDAEGLADDTLLVVTSDHGDEFFEHGGKGHCRTLFDEVLLVPLVFRQPGSVAANARVPAQVRQLDIAPTLLDWLGLEVPESMTGTSLVPSLRGAPLVDDLPAVSRLRDGSPVGMTTLRTSDTKLYVSRRPDTEVALVYDLARDPTEQRPDPEPSVHLVEHLESLTFFDDWLRGRLAVTDEPIVLPDAVRDELDRLGYVD